MEFIEGKTLRESFQKFQVLETKLTLMISIIEGMQEIHKRGVLHCDFSSNNIMVRNILQKKTR